MSVSLMADLSMFAPSLIRPSGILSPFLIVYLAHLSLFEPQSV